MSISFIILVTGITGITSIFTVTSVKYVTYVTHQHGGSPPPVERSPNRRCGPVWGKRVVSKKLLAYELQTGSLVGAEGAEVVTKKAYTPVSATRPAWSHYDRTISKP
jgi:hypothetical protein